MEAERLRRIENAIKSITKSAQNKKSITNQSIANHNVTTNSATSDSAKISNNVTSKPNALEQSKKFQVETKDMVITFCFLLFNFSSPIQITNNKNYRNIRISLEELLRSIKINTKNWIRNQSIRETF